MNVTDFNPVGKPDSVQGTLFESFAASAEDLVRQLQGVVRESARQGATFGVLPASVRELPRLTC